MFMHLTNFTLNK
jgi:hypothetical protein